MAASRRRETRLRYVCQAEDCTELFVTARGFSIHADRDHPGRDVEAKRTPVIIQR